MAVFWALQALAMGMPADSPGLSMHGRAACPISSCVNSAPILPKQDPWYTTTPAGLDAAAPGDILRVRRAPGNLTGLVPNSSAAYNILYRTTNSQYKPSYAVTTLFVPSAPAANILLSYQTAYDAIDVNQSPSYTMYASPPGADVSWALGRGWHVLVGDYEGPLASFTAGVVSGHGVIDGVRAALSLDCSAAFGGLSASTARYAMWGYSGGALASEWAAELAVQYAPELAFAGAALGGLTPNVTAMLELLDGTSGASLIPAWLLGTASQFPALEDYLVGRLKTEGAYNASTFLGYRDSTTSGAVFLFQEIGNYFIGGIQDLYAPIVFRAAWSDGVMGYHGVPRMPVYAYKAIQDELSAVADTDKLVSRYCEVGADIFYQRNTKGDHVGEFIQGNGRARAWLLSVLEGTYTQTGCKIETITDPA